MFLCLIVLRRCWQAAESRSRMSDAAFDALLQAYSSQWEAWLEDWISEREANERLMRPKRLA